jgi:hypothetical protein
VLWSALRSADLALDPAEPGGGAEVWVQAPQKQYTRQISSLIQLNMGANRASEHRWRRKRRLSFASKGLKRSNEGSLARFELRDEAIDRVSTLRSVDEA